MSKVHLLDTSLEVSNMQSSMTVQVLEVTLEDSSVPKCHAAKAKKLSPGNNLKPTLTRTEVNENN